MYPAAIRSFFLAWFLKGKLKAGGTHTGQYLMHAHSHITREVAAMDSCFPLRTNQHGIAAGPMNRENPGDMAVRMREVIA